ncbi:MAG: hypothetical protein U0836_11410 [Pirellulales bacterium]
MAEATPQTGWASFVSLSVTGTISSTNEATIPAGTPWSFELVYNTDAPDRDTELTGSADPTFGRFTNTGAPPALNFFHYQAGSYNVTLDDPTDYSTGSEIHVTFTTVHALDVNIHAPTFFPQLGGGPVSFHADFNAFSAAPVFASDALPTNTALSPASFDQSTVTLLPPAGVISGSELTSLTLRVLTPGDTSRDGSVDLTDFGVLKAHFGGTGGWAAGDFDGNGAVDLSDFGLLKANFGQAPAAVPEPAAWLLIALAVLGCWPAMRRR